MLQCSMHYLHHNVAYLIHNMQHLEAEGSVHCELADVDEQDSPLGV